MVFYNILKSNEENQENLSDQLKDRYQELIADTTTTTKREHESALSNFLATNSSFEEPPLDLR